MKNIDPTKLQIGDVVCTTDFSPIAGIIRNETWGGWKTSGDMSLGTHVGIICDRGGGLFYVSEMLGDGLCMTELSAYDNPRGSWFRHFTYVGRFPGMADVAGKINDYIIRMHSFGVKYGYSELLNFLFKIPVVDMYTLVCSQWVAEAFKAVNLPTPAKAPDHPIVTPADWQRWNRLNPVKIC